MSLLERAIEQMKPEQFGKDEKKAQTASERIREANLLLGYCYAEMGENSRRLEAYTRALPLEETGRSWIRAMFGIAEAELALGRSDDALKTYRNLARRVPSTLISVGRLELSPRHLRLTPPSQIIRRWRKRSPGPKESRGTKQRPISSPI